MSQLRRLGRKILPDLNSFKSRNKRFSNAWAIANKVINDNLRTIQNEGTWKNERIINSAQGPHIHVLETERKVINFCANNYLGLSVRDRILIDCNRFKSKPN